VATLRLWLDSWAGLGAVLEAMVRLDFDVALTRNGDAGWRALFFPSSFIHESRSGAAWGTTPWQAVQRAAWETLRRPSRGERAQEEERAATTVIDWDLNPVDAAPSRRPLHR
jgi:hypothetical protein